MCSCDGACSCNITLPIGQPGINGTDGATGASGTNGTDGVSIAIQTSVLSVGNTSCPCGGLLIEIGPDDGTGVPNPITSTSVVCNGCDGEDFNIPPGMVTMFYGDLSLPGINFDATGLGVGTLTGWALCNSQNLTPDMRGRFPIASGENQNFASNTTITTYNLSDIGGIDEHTLVSPGEIPSHTHGPGSLTTDTESTHQHSYHALTQVAVGTGTWGDNSSDETETTRSTTANTGHLHQVTSGVTGSTGTGGPHQNMPPYFTLGFIYKL